MLKKIITALMLSFALATSSIAPVQAAERMMASNEQASKSYKLKVSNNKKITFTVKKMYEPESKVYVAGKKVGTVPGYIYDINSYILEDGNRYIVIDTSLPMGKQVYIYTYRNSKLKLKYNVYEKLSKKVAWCYEARTKYVKNKKLYITGTFAGNFLLGVSYLDFTVSIKSGKLSISNSVKVNKIETSDSKLPKLAQSRELYKTLDEAIASENSKETINNITLTMDKISLRKIDGKTILFIHVIKENDSSGWIKGGEPDNESEDYFLSNLAIGG